ncbi:MAG: hypothetical protein MZV70_29090 [Desulfobacterales bacterium]|nr:hypothetical protein [Desulfobacterales bacterium]
MKQLATISFSLNPGPYLHTVFHMDDNRKARLQLVWGLLLVTGRRRAFLPHPPGHAADPADRVFRRGHPVHLFLHCISWPCS